VVKRRPICHKIASTSALLPKIDVAENDDDSRFGTGSTNTAILHTRNQWHNDYKNSSGDEIANVNFLRRYGTYVLQNAKKENLLRLTN